MGKKKFIDKKNSQTFHLLHRSHTDAAYAKEGVPSELVLVPANQVGGVHRDNGNFSIDNYFKQSGKVDHINEYGLPNDGYDYSQHLKEMGGGTFISKTGAVMSQAPIKPIELPEDVLPSKEELERNLEAITISHECMDEDLKAALFDGFDEEGEFEELDDDFIQQVMTEPEIPDFDFEAHLAKLLNISESQIGIKKKGKGHQTEDFDEDEEDIDVDDLISDVHQIQLTDEKRAALEKQFERAMEEYDDEYIGELDDCLLEEDEENGIDEDNEEFNEAMDEFLQEQKDLIYANGDLVRKGARNVVIVKKDQDGNIITEEIDPSYLEPIDFKKSYLLQEELQKECAETIQELIENNEDQKMRDEIAAQPVKKVEDWDCETIISTYSTTDNHPSLIKDTKSKFKPYIPRHMRKENSDGSVSGFSFNSRNTPKVPIQKITEKTFSTDSTQKIILTGKLNLPEGFAPFKNSSKSSKTNKRRDHQLKNIDEPIEEGDNESDDESEEDDEGADSEASSDDDSNDVEKRKKQGKVKETAEEKKLRKAQVKEERRMKRLSKKQLKLSFKTEKTKIIQTLGKEQSIEHVSVFRYTS